MAWLLQFPASTAYIVTGRLVLGAGHSVSFDIQRDSDVNIYLSSDSNDELRYIVGTGWQIRISGAYYTYPEASLTPPIGERFTVTFSRDGSTSNRSVQLNGGPIVTKATATFNFWFNNIGQGVGGVYQAFKLYKCTVTNPSAPATNRVFDADASGGTGTILVNTLTGTNNGTQAGAGWPSDNSEWVFYSSGGTYTLSADGATFSYSGAAANTLFNRQLPSDGATYSYSGGAAPPLYNRRLSADGAVYAYSGGTAAALYNRKLSADGGTYSYSGAAATLTYTAAGVVYTLNADGGVFGYTGAAAQLLANRALTADGGSFTYSGGNSEFDFNGYPQADAGAFVVSYRIAGDTVLTASISESTRFSAIISQSTNIKYMVN